MMYGHPIAKEMEAFWRDHAGRHSDPLWLAYLDAYAELLKLKLTEMGEAHSNGGRFGMSKAGGCTRAASLKHLGHDSQLTGSTRATFAIGHQVEVMALATLKVIGYPLTNVQGRVTIEPMMESAIDAETVLNGLPTIVSVKSAGYKMSGYNFKARTWTRYGFAQFPLDGVKQTNPGYWAQAQAEQVGASASQTLLIVVAKDMIKKMEGDPILQQNGSLTFYAELIPCDPAFSDELHTTWLHQWAFVNEGDPGAAMYLNKSGKYVQLSPGDAKRNKQLTGTYDPCSYCDVSDACSGALLQSQLTASIELVRARNV